MENTTQNLDPSDHRFGVKDEDGSPMPEIVNANSDSNEHDVVPETEKITVNEDKPFLNPIELEAKTRAKIVKLFKKTGEEIYLDCQIFLWNKLSDPNIHPNDYLHLEDEVNSFVFTHVITTCKGLFLLTNLNKSLVGEDETLDAVDDELFESALDAVLESGKEFNDDETDDAESDAVEKSGEHEVDMKMPEDLVSEFCEKFSLEDMKIKEAFAMFKSACCQRRNDGTCDKRHYLVGRGKIVVENQEYEGIHIYLYPDIHYEQADDPKHQITDPLYLQFQKERKFSISKGRRQYYVLGYMREFRRLLRHIH